MEWRRFVTTNDRRSL